MNHKQRADLVRRASRQMQERFANLESTEHSMALNQKTFHPPSPFLKKNLRK